MSLLSSCDAVVLISQCGISRLYGFGESFRLDVMIATGL
jgi:hypothetical protein